jgi:alpha/beta hydrolase family protein
VLVGGALVDPLTGRAGRAENAPLAAELAASFTVLNYDRRGRADSGDTLPYAVEREIEDLAAVIAEAGGSAHVYGASSGGALALRAALAGVAIDRLAVYEVPYFVGALEPWRQYVDALDAALGDGRRGDAVELFMRVAGAPEEAIASARASEMWPGLEAIAHTLAYDAACLGDGLPPQGVTTPTLVATGGGEPFFEQAADATAAAIPGAQRVIVAGQGHFVDPTALAPVLDRFFRG